MSKQTQGDWSTRFSGFGDYLAVEAIDGNGKSKTIHYLHQGELGTDTQEKWEEAMSNAELFASSKKLLKHLKTMHVCYAKGIQPAVTTLKEIDALIQRLS